MATIGDVAELAGVSKTTVSHVINESRYVLPETRQAVLNAIVQLNYRPSALARGLATNVTGLIGAIVADITNPFFGALVRGIDDQLSTQDLGLIVCNTDEYVDQEARSLELLLEKRVDGLVIAPTGEAQPIYSQFRDHGIPLVFVDRRPPEPYGPAVVIDNVAAGYAATEHLLQLGHRRIAFIGRHLNLSTAAGRVMGYRQALEAYGALADDLVAIADSSLESAITTARQLLVRSEPPTGIVTGNYVMTLAMLEALEEQRLSCPDDISLVCFDDLRWMRSHKPPLTAIQLPIDGMCRAVVETLTQVMDGRPRNRREAMEWDVATTPDVVLKARLVPRFSCRPPAI